MNTTESLCWEIYSNKELHSLWCLGSWTPPNRDIPSCLRLPFYSRRVPWWLPIIKILTRSTLANAFRKGVTLWKRKQLKALTYIPLNLCGYPWRPAWETSESPRPLRNWKMASEHSRNWTHLRFAQGSLVIYRRYFCCSSRRGRPFRLLNSLCVCDIWCACAYFSTLTYIFMPTYPSSSWPPSTCMMTSSNVVYCATVCENCVANGWSLCDVDRSVLKLETSSTEANLQESVKGLTYGIGRFPVVWICNV